MEALASALASVLADGAESASQESASEATVPASVQSPGLVTERLLAEKGDETEWGAPSAIVTAALEVREIAAGEMGQGMGMALAEVEVAVSEVIQGGQAAAPFEPVAEERVGVGVGELETRDVAETVPRTSNVSCRCCSY